MDNKLLVTRKHLYKTIQKNFPDSIIEDESISVFFLRREYLFVCDILYAINIIVHCNRRKKIKNLTRLNHHKIIQIFIKISHINIEQYKHADEIVFYLIS